MFGLVIILSIGATIEILKALKIYEGSRTFIYLLAFLLAFLVIQSYCTIEAGIKWRKTYIKKKCYNDDELFSALKNDGIGATTKQINKAKNGDIETFCYFADQYYDMMEKYHYIDGKYYSFNGRNGVVVENNYDHNKNFKALAWYHKAAAKNSSHAQYKIGAMHYWAYGVAQNFELANEWYLKAVNNDGNKDAQFGIGYRYHCGDGVPRNMRVAVDWYEKAANQGHADGLYYVADAYETQEEVKDLQKAVNWFKKCQEAGMNTGDRILHLNNLGYYPQDVDQDENKIVREIPPITGIKILHKLRNEIETRDINTASYISSPHIDTKVMELEIKLRLLEVKVKRIDDILQSKVILNEQENIQGDSAQKTSMTLERTRNEKHHLRQKIDTLGMENTSLNSKIKSIQ